MAQVLSRETFGMKDQWKKRVTIVTGIITGVLLVLFFLLVRGLSVSYVVELHLFNLLFIVAAVWISIHIQFRQSGIGYLKGILEGFKTTLISSFILNFFLLIYLRFINPEYMLNMKSSEYLGEFMTPVIIAIVLFTEQVGAGIVIALLVMQLYKTKDM
jgi:hypothetical protein